MSIAESWASGSSRHSHLSMDSITSGNWSEISTAVSTRHHHHKADPWSLDVSKLIDEVIAVRFPRLTADGEWETPESFDLAKDLRKKFISTFQPPETLTKAFSFSWNGPAEDVRPRLDWLLSALKTYSMDLVEVVVFLTGSLIFGHYYTVVCGFFTNIAMVFQNVGKLADRVFDFFDYLEEEFNEAIDRLQYKAEMQALTMIHPPPFGLAVAISLKVAIDAAQYSFSLRNLLPVILQVRLKFMLYVCAPLILVHFLHFTIQLYFAHEAVEDNGGVSNSFETLSRSLTAVNLTVTMLANGSRKVFPPSDLELIETVGRGPLLDLERLEHGGGWNTAFAKQLVMELLGFLLMAVIKSWPFVRLVVNNLVAFAEWMTNRLLRKHLTIDGIVGTVSSFASESLHLAQRGCERACTM